MPKAADPMIKPRIPGKKMIETADREMTLLEHLAELRSRLIKSGVGLLIATLVAWFFHEPVFRFMVQPVMRGLAPHGIASLQAIDVTEGISVYMKSSLAAAFVISSPWLIWQAAAFIAPALRRREKRLFSLATGLVALFFVLGVTFSYGIFVPMVVDFLAGFSTASGDMTLVPTIRNAFGMAMFFLVAFGFIFELPLVMMFAGMLHLISWRTFLRYLRHFIVIAFIIAAVLTPPEPISQILMAIPLCLLYVLGILMAWAGWQAGGEKPGARSFLVAATAIILFAGGTIAAAAFWKGSAPEASPGPAGKRTVTITLDQPCVRMVSGWSAPDGQKLDVSFGPDGNVEFTAPAGVDLPILPQGNRPVDRFVAGNASRIWRRADDDANRLMVPVEPREASKLLNYLLTVTESGCR